MNAPEHHRDQLSESMLRLKGWTYGWIQSLQCGPTPESFPFNEVPMQTAFAWNEYSPGRTHDRASVQLKFTRLTSGDDTEDPTTRFFWTVTASSHHHPPCLLSYFEVDCRIVFDPRPLVSLNADLIIRALLTSLHECRFLELSSTIIPETPSLENCHLPALDRCIETFQIRDTLDQDYVIELEHGRRWISRRQCGACGCLIPPNGPPLCLADLYPSASQDVRDRE